MTNGILRRLGYLLYGRRRHRIKKRRRCLTEEPGRARHLRDRAERNLGVRTSAYTGRGLDALLDVSDRRASVGIEAVSTAENRLEAGNIRLAQGLARRRQGFLRMAVDRSRSLLSEACSNGRRAPGVNFNVVRRECGRSSRVEDDGM